MPADESGPGRDLRVRADLVIPAAELEEAASRSGGPGGQHVNKTSTRVSLRWNVIQSSALSDAQRRRLCSQLESRLTRAGDLVVHAAGTRSQSRNRELARERLVELVVAALARRKPRRPTRPTRASKTRRVDEKTRRGGVKRTRGRVSRDSD
jgi:ribosome-associated protein